MKTWDDVTKEELVHEMTDDVYTINEELQNQLNWTEYLRHLRDMLSWGMLDDPLITREHLQDVVVDIFMDMTKVIQDRYPEPEEIQEYIRSSYAQQTINSLTEIALKLTHDNWPDFKERICEEAGLDPDEF